MLRALLANQPVALAAASVVPPPAALEARVSLPQVCGKTFLTKGSFTYSI